LIVALERPRILYLLGVTLGQLRRSGVHRVAVETARALATRADLHLVRYDSLEGGLRHLDADEIDDIFGAGDWPPGVRVDPRARRVGRPFRDGFDRAKPPWLLVPEVVWHEAQGTEKLARAISQCRAWGVRTAHIFYDLIPIHNPVYQGGAAPHAAYVAELVRTDLILAISTDSGEQLAAYWAAQGVQTTPPIVSAPLPDGGFSKATPKAAGDVRARTGPIALIGTVEPRKRQMQVLKAFAAARAKSPEAAKRKLLVIGSLHPYVANAFNAFIARNPWVDYRDYVSDAELSAAYATAEFSVFASDDEGYGLPIAESLTAGAPCLCANFGAMGEIAAGGGCFAVDVRDDAALEAAIVTLCEQPAERARLHREIASRKFQTWGDYADTLLHHMAQMDAAPHAAAPQPRADGAKDLTQVMAFDSAAARTRFVETTDRALEPGLLPSRLAIGQAEAAGMAAEVNAETTRRARIAATEAAYRTACAATARQYPAHPLRPIFLRVLISTFNRRDFVTANVQWLLKSILPTTDVTIDLVVVDGGSTDGTVQALRQIVDPRFTLVESPANVGMLGGLRESSKPRDAFYVWVVGDDDYIRPKEFAAIVKALQDNVGVPLAALNFGVYHRAAWNPGDQVEHLQAEAHPMAAAPAQSGLIPVARAAEQHDNLFTAIYSLVWRADVFSAAFDHAFDGSPFSSLTEAIPCTEAVVGEFGACDILWWGAPAVAGNAHNSWSHHRPRWHGLVMPQAFALARDIGVDPAILQQWADMHLDLFREALAIAKARDTAHGLTPAMLDLAHIHFRQDVTPELNA
jgi:glycosyltransferase involved in cell wall biosynthesis